MTNADFDFQERKRLARQRANLRNANAPDWSQDECDALAELLRQKLSFNKIGIALGKTRNAVAGRVWRMNRSAF